MNILAFPGQGSQKIGMGKVFYENFYTAKSVFEEVDDTLNFKLSKLILLFIYIKLNFFFCKITYYKYHII